MADIPLSDEDISTFRGDAESMMTDECCIASRIEVKSGSGELIAQEEEHIEWGNPIRCSFDVRPGSKAFGTNHTLLIYDAGIRLPSGTVVDIKGWIKRTKRFGIECEGPIYGIVSPAQDGPSADRYYLKRVET
jgi:hypothetical protein